jgi:hypothetical protein
MLLTRPRTSWGGGVESYSKRTEADTEKSWLDSAKVCGVDSHDLPFGECGASEAKRGVVLQRAGSRIDATGCCGRRGSPAPPVSRGGASDALERADTEGAGGARFGGGLEKILTRVRGVSPPFVGPAGLPVISSGVDLS